MERNSRRGIRDLAPILDEMHRARGAAVKVVTNYPINGEPYNKAGAVLTALDDLSEALTGDRKAHWPIRRDNMDGER